jgi:pyruvate dehydrogenase (quinone)
VRPPDDELRRAAELLNAGERVAMLVGQGARGATDEVLAVADALGAGIAKALNGLAVVPDDVPFVTGSVGLIGTRASARMMSGCDTLLMAGTGFPYAEWLPEPGAARAVQIDIDPSRLGTRYPTEVNLVGDAAETLRALLPLLRRRDPDDPWRRRIAEDVDRWRAQLAEEAEASADPVNPQQVFEALAARLPDNAILLADSGSATAWWARHLRIRRGMDAALSGTLATMCPAVPYALAARLAHPTRPVIATTGDGAMQMLGINGLIDLARHVPDGAAPTVVLVVNNGDLNLVSWEQRAMAGEPKLDASQDLPPFDHAAFARQIGLEGIRVERPVDVGPALDRALAARRPVVVDVVCDPEVPPLPPEIRADEAKGFAKAVVKGDSGARHMVEQAVKGAIRDLGTRS